MNIDIYIYIKILGPRRLMEDKTFIYWGASLLEETVCRSAPVTAMTLFTHLNSECIPTAAAASLLPSLNFLLLYLLPVRVAGH